MTARTRQKRGAFMILHSGLSLALLPVSVTLAVIAGYLGLLTAAAWREFLRRQRRPVGEQEPDRQFAVVIPAHNEERLIGDTLKSLAEIDYPASRYTVHVIADNCTDGTAGIAAMHGARVHTRSDPDARGKGPALSWGLDRLRERRDPFDAVVILDADSVVSRNFLRVMDDALSRGAKAVQAYYAVRDHGRSWQIALRSAALAVRHYLRPLARTSLGGSAGLRGNGMAFTADLLQERNWSSHLTEDLEFEALLILDSERVAFAPDAIVEAEMPATLKDAQTQNSRWERGRIDVARRYVPRLLRSAVRPGTPNRLACVDAAVDHMVPPMSVLTAAIGAAGALSAALRLQRKTKLSRLNCAVMVGAGAVEVAHLCSGLRLVQAPAAVWLSLVRAPVYVAWKVVLWLRAGLGEAPQSWIRTAR